MNSRFRNIDSLDNIYSFAWTRSATECGHEHYDYNALDEYSIIARGSYADTVGYVDPFYLQTTCRERCVKYCIVDDGEGMGFCCVCTI